MTQSQHTDPSGAAKPARSPRRWLLAAALTLAVGAAGATMASDGFSLRQLHGGGAPHGAVDPAQAERHINKMVEHLLSDGTPQQKQRLAAIVKSAFADLHPLRAQFRDAHKRIHEILMQPTVDRIALEAVRAEQMHRADAVSKRIVAAIADAAEILTPEQRLRFAEHMKKRMHH